MTRRLVRMLFISFGVVFASVFLSGCHAVSSPLPGDSTDRADVSAQVRQQLMIRLDQAVVSCTAEDIAKLATATSQALQYVRPMSGNACVVSHAANSEATLAAGLQRLRQHPSVEIADVDKIVTIRK